MLKRALWIAGLAITAAACATSPTTPSVAIQSHSPASLWMDDVAQTLTLTGTGFEQQHGLTLDGPTGSIELPSSVLSVTSTTLTVTVRLPVAGDYGLRIIGRRGRASEVYRFAVADTSGCVTVAHDPRDGRPHRYIVMFRSGVAVTPTIDRLVARFGFQVATVFNSLGGFTATLDPPMVRGIRCDPDVRTMDLDGIVIPAIHQ